MTTWNEVIFALPLGLIYYVFVQKLAEVVFPGQNDKSRQSTLAFLVVAGIVAIVVALTFFANNKTYKNATIKNGLVVGGIILLLYPTLTNWDTLANETKLLLIGALLAGLVWYVYRGKGSGPRARAKADDGDT